MTLDDATGIIQGLREISALSSYLSLDKVKTLETKKALSVPVHPHTESLPSWAEQAMMLQMQRGEICGCVRGSSSGRSRHITDSWGQLACLRAEVRSAVFLPATAFTSAEELKDYSPPVSWCEVKRTTGTKVVCSITAEKRWRRVGVCEMLLIGFASEWHPCFSLHQFSPLSHFNSSLLTLQENSPQVLSPNRDILTLVTETASSLRLTMLFLSKQSLGLIMFAAGMNSPSPLPLFVAVGFSWKRERNLLPSGHNILKE